MKMVSHQRVSGYLTLWSEMNFAQQCGKNNFGKPVIHLMLILAVSSTSFAYGMEAIILYYPSDVHQKNKGGWTPLYFVSENRYHDALP